MSHAFASFSKVIIGSYGNRRLHCVALHNAAVADALVSVLTDESLRRRNAAASVQRAKVFSWERTVDAYEAVLMAGSPLIPQSPGVKKPTSIYPTRGF